MVRTAISALCLGLALSGAEKIEEKPAPISAEDKSRLLQVWLDLANLETQYIHMQRRISETGSQLSKIIAEMKVSYKAEDCVPVIAREQTGQTKGVEWQCSKKEAEVKDGPVSNQAADR